MRWAMNSFRRVRDALHALPRSESGIAVPTALAALTISMALVSTAVVASVNTQRGSSRDQASKAAIAAADAGVNLALLRQNKMAGMLTESTPCLALSGGVLVPSTAAADGWCPAVSGSVGTATYSYRVSPAVGGQSSLVATGTADGVGRRVLVGSQATTVGSVLSVEGMIGQDGITLSNNADIRVSIGTNGDVNVSNNASVCGNIRHGVGRGAHFDNNGTQCSGYALTEGSISLPPPPVPADIATNNSNFRLVKCTSKSPAWVPTGCESDTYNKSRSSTVPWNPATRTISTGNNATITLGGGDYWLCKLSLSNNAHLIMAQGAKVRLFFDTPENCNQSSGVKQVDISNNANITSTGYQPSLGQYDVPGIYMLGSPTIATYATWANNTGTNEFVLYAPNTHVVLANNSTYIGALAGKTVTLENNAVVKSDAGFVPPQIGGTTLHQRSRYVECIGATASPPDASC
jgi:hypothetical protein